MYRLVVQYLTLLKLCITPLAHVKRSESKDDTLSTSASDIVYACPPTKQVARVPTSFININDISYMIYRSFPGSFDERPNGTEVVLSIFNPATQHQVACIFTELADSPSQSMPSWYPCDDSSSSYEDGSTRTFVSFDQNTTKLAINQMWSCDQDESNTYLYVNCLPVLPPVWRSMLHLC